ncbi:unnamed protein product [Arabidopsis halleri]
MNDSQTFLFFSIIELGILTQDSPEGKVKVVPFFSSIFEVPLTMLHQVSSSGLDFKTFEIGTVDSGLVADAFADATGANWVEGFSAGSEFPAIAVMAGGAEAGTMVAPCVTKDEGRGAEGEAALAKATEGGLPGDRDGSTWLQGEEALGSQLNGDPDAVRDAGGGLRKMSLSPILGERRELNTLKRRDPKPVTLNRREEGRRREFSPAA